MGNGGVNMLRVTVNNQEAMDALSNMGIGMSSATERILNKIADETREKMRSEAPIGESGNLRENISIRAIYVETNKRIIEPMATNLGGQKYGQYVEAGTGPAAGHAKYMPNVESIAKYFAVDKKLAWAMALRIKETGTKANDFVNRTFIWLQARMSSFAGELADNITAYYVSRR